MGTLIYIHTCFSSASNKINKVNDEEQIKRKEEKDKDMDDSDKTVPHKRRKKHPQGN